mmetsp:Transcript_41972/g.135793  ORF Transcript_41972/g.135793 Transcript_41972/m.135793 type:complete len:97 (-) Transcript_41972:78-368(-)
MGSTRVGCGMSSSDAAHHSDSQRYRPGDGSLDVAQRGSWRSRRLKPDLSPVCQLSAGFTPSAGITVLQFYRDGHVDGAPQFYRDGHVDGHVLRCAD